MTDAGSGMGWWPKLLLWGTAILVGALYLGSVERHREDARTQPREQSAGPAVPNAVGQGGVAPARVSGSGAGPVVGVPESTAPATARTVEPQAAEVTPPPEQVRPTEQPPVSGAAAPAPKPVEHDSEPAPSRVTPLPVAATPPPAAESVAQAPAPEPSHAAPIAAPTTPALAPQIQAPAAEMQSAAGALEVSPAEAKAFAEAVTESSPEAQTPSVPSPVPGLAAGAPSGRAQTPADAERARILAEYEALRRATEAELGLRGGRAQPAPYGRPPYGRPRGYPGPAPYGAGGAGVPYPPTYPGW